MPEYPGKIYYGVVEASARAVDAAVAARRACSSSSTTASGELMPGAFANTRIELPATLQALSIPAGALIFGQKGLRVATVRRQQQGRAEAHHDRAAISARWSRSPPASPRTDRVIDSPPDGLSDGDPVRVVTPAKPR